MIEKFFDDPRHRRSEELAFFADIAASKGDIVKALADYAEAARLEEENALEVPGELQKLRTLLAISAVALWLRAEQWDEAARAGCAFLAKPRELTPDGRRELQSYVDRAWRAAEVEAVFGKDGAYAPLEAKLSGGLIRCGLAPSTIIGERRDVLVPLLLRVAEWRCKKRFRRAGPSTLANTYDILEAPALASSYAFQLYLGVSGQQLLGTDIATPDDVMAAFLQIAQAAAEPEAVRELVQDHAYTQAFLRGFRDLAPDGKTIERVELGAFERTRALRTAVLTPEMRDRLTVALRRHDGERPVRVEGVLKSVNLRGDEPKIGVDTDLGVRVFRIVKGEHDDTISPKLNRRVYILCMRRVSEAGEADDWADDVVVIDDAPVPAAAE